jgi:hypothetical protein
MGYKKLLNNIQQNFQPQGASSPQPQTDSSAILRPLDHTKRQLMQGQQRTSNMASGLQNQEERQVAASCSESQYRLLDPRRNMSAGITPYAAHNGQFITYENGSGFFGVETKTLQTRGRVTSLPSQHLKSSTAAGGQPGSSLDNAAIFSNRNEGAECGGSQRNQEKSMLRVVANSVAVPTPLQMEVQPYLAGQSTQQDDMLQHEIGNTSFTGQNNGQYDVFSQESHGNSSSFNAVHQFHQVQPPQVNGSYVELRHLDAADPHQDFQTPTSSQLQRIVRHSSNKPATKTHKFPFPAPHRPYEANDFIGIRRGGKKLEKAIGKKKSGDWNMETEANHLQHFLRYHGRTALSDAPAGKSEYQHRADSVRALSDLDRALLMQFVLAHKYWLENRKRKLPNPPYVQYSPIHPTGDDENELDHQNDGDGSYPQDDETESGDHHKTNDQEGIDMESIRDQQITPSKKTSPGHEKVEPTKLPVATKDTHPIKKIRTNTLPRGLPQFSQKGKTQQPMDVRKPKLAFGSLTAVDEHMAREGLPSLLELANEHLASKGRRTIQLTGSLGLEVPNWGFVTASGVGFNNLTAIEVSNPRTESSSSSGIQFSNPRKRKIRTDCGDQTGDTEILGQSCKKTATASAENSGFEEQRSLPQQQKIQSKTLHGSGPYSIQYPTVESADLDFAETFQRTHCDRSGAYSALNTSQLGYRPIAQETSDQAFSQTRMGYTSFSGDTVSSSQTDGQAALEEEPTTQLANEEVGNRNDDLDFFDFNAYLDDMPSASNDEKANRKFEFENSLPEAPV